MAGPWEKYASQKTANAAPAQAPTAGPWSKYADRIAAVSRVPKPEEPDRAAQAANWAGNASTAAGLAAPAIAMMQGAPALPILGGLAGSAAAGAATDYALRKTGATPWLEEKARNLRADVPMPQTRSVPLNFIANLGIEATHPKAVAANVLEAAPMLASSYAGSKGALGGAKLPGFITKSVMGGPKVPVGQEAAALLNTAGTKFSGDLATSEKKLSIGGIKEPFEKAVESVGKEVGDVKKVAFSAATQPKDSSAVARQAIEDALISKGIGKEGNKFLVEASETPKENKKIVRMLSKAVPEIRSIEDLDVLSRQAKEAAHRLMQDGPIKSPKGAAAFSGVVSKLEDAIDTFVPPKELADLQGARRKFSTLKNFEKMVLDSDNKGEFSPGKFVAEWKRLGPKEKAKNFEPEQIQAIEDLIRADEPGVVGKGITALMRGLQILASKTVLRGSQMGGFLENPVSEKVRFNLPPRQVPPVETKNIEAIGALQGAQASERGKNNAAERAKRLASGR